MKIGTSFGLCLPVVFTTFNQYFVVRRVFVMSLGQAIIGIGMMGYPILINFLMETYGFRGMCAIMAAINANIIVAMLAMHPIEWHYKVIEVPVHEEQPCKSKSRNVDENMIFIFFKFFWWYFSDE